MRHYTKDPPTKQSIITSANDSQEPLIPAVSRRFHHQFPGGSPSFALVLATDGRGSETLVSERWGTAVAPRRSSDLTTCWQMIQGPDPKTLVCFVTAVQEEQGIGGGGMVTVV